MKTYKALSMSIVELKDVDVITTSGGYTDFNPDWLFSALFKNENTEGGEI